MKLLILKSDIETKAHQKSLEVLFDTNPNILSWSIDLEDIDKVLRMEVTESIDEKNIINILKKQGFYCEDLKD